MGLLAAVHSMARDFARTYSALVEALLAEGVPEEVARYEARTVAMVAMIDYECGDEDAGSEFY